MQIDDNNPFQGQGYYNKLMEINKNHDVEKRDNANKSDNSKDKITISGKTKNINEIKSLLDNYPEIRMDRIDVIKKAIDSGLYNIDTKALARKMLEEILLFS